MPRSSYPFGGRVNRFFRILTVTALVLGLVGPLSTVTTFAQTPVAAQAGSQTGVVNGSIHDASGAPVSNATVKIAGATALTSTTDAQGTFSFANVTPGIYSFTATKAGYDTAMESSIAVLGGQTQTLAVTMNTITFSSLRTIATVRAAGRGTFNTTSASVNVVSSQTYADQAQVQVQRVLDQTPGIVIDHPGTSATNASPGAITFPSIRGGLGFETASLIDGHPLAVGLYGDYVTTFLNSYMLQTTELVKGPGAASPQVNYAIGGTVNFRTKDPTSTPMGQIVQSVDSRGGTFSNYLTTGSTPNGKLGWVFGYGVDGETGPMSNNSRLWNVPRFTSINGNPFTVFTTNPPSNASTNGNQNNPFYYRSSLVACCFSVSQVYDNKTELAKLRYKFSNSTVFTMSYLGSQTWTDQNGNHVYGFNQLFQPASSYTGPLAPNQTFLTWQNVFAPQGEWEINNEPIFQGELRTTIGNDTLLGRWYGASINRLQYNAMNSPADKFSMNQTLYGTYCTSFANPCPAANLFTFNGTPATVTFDPAISGQYYCLTYNTAGLNWTSNPYVVNPAGANNVCQYNAQGKIVKTGGVTSSPTGVFYNGTFFRSAEEDRIHGTSFEYDRPFASGADLLTVSYDRNSFGTHAYSYAGDPSGPPSVPFGSGETLGTLLVRGSFQVSPRWNLVLANYFNSYGITFSPDGGFSFKTTNFNHYDARLGATYRPNSNVALRLGAGTAIAPPYLGLFGVSTLPAPPQSGATFVTNKIANNNLAPETSFGFDVGGDFRYWRDPATTLTLDLYSSTLRNQFTTQYVLSCANWDYTANTCASAPGPTTLPLITSQNENLTNVKYQGIEAALVRRPVTGFGYRAQGALVQAYPYNLPPCFYSNNPSNCSLVNTNLGVIPGVNFYGSGTSGSPGSFNAVNNHAIPYAQAYLEGNYTFANGAYFAMGTQLYGNHNSLNVPAFWVVNATLRSPTFGGGLSVQASADNLFNAYPNTYITPFAGIAVPLANGKLGLTNQNVIGPDDVRLTLMWNIGGTKH